MVSQWNAAVNSSIDGSVMGSEDVEGRGVNDNGLPFLYRAYISPYDITFLCTSSELWTKLRYNQ